MAAPSPWEPSSASLGAPPAGAPRDGDAAVGRRGREACHGEPGDPRRRRRARRPARRRARAPGPLRDGVHGPRRRFRHRRPRRHPPPRPPRDPAGPDRLRPADADDDRHRAPGRLAGAGPGRPPRPPHCLCGHRRGDPGHQRDPPRPVPPEAVGSSRGAALPGPRRPALRLAGHLPARVRGDPPRGAPLVGPGPRDQGLPGPQPRAVPLGGRGSRTRRRIAWRPRRGSSSGATPCSSSRTARTCWPRPTPRSPRRSGCARAPTCGPTTSSSSAAARPASRRRSTARRRA